MNPEKIFDQPDPTEGVEIELELQRKKEKIKRWAVHQEIQLQLLDRSAPNTDDSAERDRFGEQWVKANAEHLAMYHEIHPEYIDAWIEGSDKEREEVLTALENACASGWQREEAA